MDVYELIKNINTLYKPAITEQGMKFYHEYLVDYTDKQRKELWSSIMTNHVKTTPPTIGELHKYSTTVLSGYQERPVAKKHPSDEEYLDSYLGKIALKQGWAHSYIVHCMDKGVPPQNDETLLAFQKGQDAAARAYATLSEDNFFDKPLIELYKSMREKNERLKRNFIHLWSDKEVLEVPYWAY